MHACLNKAIGMNTLKITILRRSPLMNTPTHSEVLCLRFLARGRDDDGEDDEECLGWKISKPVRSADWTPS